MSDKVNEALEEAKQQIEYLHGKFTATGTGNAVIARIDEALALLSRQASLQTVQEPDFVLMPRRLTAENGAKAALSGEFSETIFVECPECKGYDEDMATCDVCDANGQVPQHVPIEWTTIKAIYAKAVESCAAHPLQDGEKDAIRGKFLIEHAFKFADVDLTATVEGANCVLFRPRFQIPEPAGMSYEDGEWTVDDIRAALDAAIAAIEGGKPC